MWTVLGSLTGVMASSKCVGPPPATNSGECLVVDFIELVYGRLVVRVVSPEVSLVL